MAVESECIGVPDCEASTAVGVIGIGRSEFFVAVVAEHTRGGDMVTAIS